MPVDAISIVKKSRMSEDGEGSHKRLGNFSTCRSNGRKAYLSPWIHNDKANSFLDLAIGEPIKFGRKSGSDTIDRVRQKNRLAAGLVFHDAFQVPLAV
jgi:hypothetical protein